jgi:hypothetical protein
MLDARDLSGVEGNGDRFVEAGSYTLTLGEGQPGTTAPQSEQIFHIVRKTETAGVETPT